MYEIHQEARQKEEVETAEINIEDLPVLKPRPRREPIKISKNGDVFVVEVPRIARIAAMLEVQDWNARMQFMGHLQRTGVIKALDEAGLMPGDTVRFGEMEWVWE